MILGKLKCMKAISILFLLTYGLIGCQRASDTIAIGIVLPLSGSMAEYGQNGREGLTLASEELLQRQDIKKFALKYQDSRESPQETVDAVRRLVDAEGVRFIIGGLTSSGVLAAAPYTQANGVLFFSPAASAPGIPEIGDLVFRNWPGDDATARQFGQAAYDRLGIRRVAILHVSNDYGKVNAESFAESFRGLGGTVLLTRAFPQGATDFKALVTQVAGLKNIDKVFVVAYPDEFRAFFQEATASTLKRGSVLACDTFYSPNLVAELGSSAEGTVCGVTSKPGPDYEPRVKFIERYRARFKTQDGQPKDPGLVSDTAYDALCLLATAISRTDATPKAVSRWLLKEVKNYPGAAGPTTFTDVGDVKGELALYQVKAGKFRPLGD